MKNWVIDQEKELPLKIGTFLIQVTTIEFYLEKIYSLFIKDSEKIKSFSEKTFGRKIKEVSNKISIGDIKHVDSTCARLFMINSFRNKIAHKCLFYEPIKKDVLIKGKSIKSDLEKKLKESNELLSDIFILYTHLNDPKTPINNYKKRIL